LLTDGRIEAYEPLQLWALSQLKWQARCLLLALSCCDQLLNVFVILSHSGGLLLINLFAQQLRQLDESGRDPSRLVAGEHLRRRPTAGLVLEVCLAKITLIF
jgi:hypothetical protein